MKSVNADVQRTELALHTISSRLVAASTPPPTRGVTSVVCRSLVVCLPVKSHCHYRPVTAALAATPAMPRFRPPSLPQPLLGRVVIPSTHFAWSIFMSLSHNCSLAESSIHNVHMKTTSKWFEFLSLGSPPWGIYCLPKLNCIPSAWSSGHAGAFGGRGHSGGVERSEPAVNKISAIAFQSQTAVSLW